MAYVHPSARPQGSPTDFWCMKGATANNPFLEYDLQSRARAAAAAASHEKDEESKWLDDVKFGLAHINPIGEIIVKPHKYRLVMDMLHFKPEEISIRAVKKGFFVRAAHPEKMEDGREYITHHFYREYVLPHDIDPTRACSWMTPQNILFIEAPKVEFDPSEIDEDDEGHNVKEVKVIRCESY